MTDKKRCLSIILAALLVLLSGCIQTPKSKSFALPISEKKEDERLQQEEMSESGEFSTKKIYKNYIEQYAVNGERVCGFLEEENKLFFMKKDDDATEAVFYEMDYRYGFYEEYARVELEPDNFIREQEAVINDRQYYDVSADGRYFAYVYMEEETWHIRLVDLLAGSEKTIASWRDTRDELGLGEYAYEMHCRFLEDGSALMYWWNLSIIAQEEIKSEIVWLTERAGIVFGSGSQDEERLLAIYEYTYLEIKGYDLATEESEVWYFGGGGMADVYRTAEDFNVTVSADGSQAYFWLYNMMLERDGSMHEGDEAYDDEAYDGNEAYVSEVESTGGTDLLICLFVIDTAYGMNEEYFPEFEPEQVFYVKGYAAIQYHYQGLQVGRPNRLLGWGYDEADESLQDTIYRIDSDYTYYSTVHDVFFGIRDSSTGSDLLLFEKENNLQELYGSIIYKSNEYIHRIEMNQQGDKMLLFTSSSPRNNLGGSAAMQITVIEF